MSDDDRIAYLAGDTDEPLNTDDQAELDDLQAVLADPKLWAEPPPTLEDSIVDTITQAHNTTNDASATRAFDPSGTVVPFDQPRRRHRRSNLIIFTTAAAAAVIVVIALSAMALIQTGAPTDSFAMTLAPTEVAAPETTGTATLTKTPSGWQVNLDATLERLDNGRYYQAWLETPEGTAVPIGTFNEGNNVVLWAGVSPRDFPILTISEAHVDNSQINSGRIVLTGTITE